MKKLLTIFCLVIVSVDGFSQRVKSGRPNIVLIVADDLGVGELGCYGQQKIETPNIDRLAGEGMRFSQFYAGTAVCAPSRSSLLTGLHTGHAPVRGNKGVLPEGQTPLPDSSVTFVSSLQKAGYSTAAFGKWGLGYVTSSGAPDKKGFDQFFGYNCQSLAHNYFPDHLWNNRQRVDFPENLKSNTFYSADIIHKRALEFLDEVDQPFFLFLPYTLPHAEVISPDDSLFRYYVKKFREQPDTSKRRYDNRFITPYPHAAYAAMVSRLDRYVGDIMSALQRKGVDRNTIIIFTSDNGPHREGGGDPDYFDGNGIFKGIKRDLYEGGIRVPFIAWWKGAIRPGKTSQPAAFWDIYPTLLDIAGVPGAANVDGISIVSTLLKKGKQQQHEYFYWEFHENNGRQAVRWNKWKGIKLQVSAGNAPPMELYDLDTDPGEQHNIAARHPDIVQRLEHYMRQAHSPNPDWPLLPGEK